MLPEVSNFQNVFIFLKFLPEIVLNNRYIIIGNPTSLVIAMMKIILSCLLCAFCQLADAIGKYLTL